MSGLKVNLCRTVVASQIFLLGSDINKKIPWNNYSITNSTRTIEEIHTQNEENRVYCYILLFSFCSILGCSLRPPVQNHHFPLYVHNIVFSPVCHCSTRIIVFFSKVSLKNTQFTFERSYYNFCSKSLSFEPLGRPLLGENYLFFVFLITFLTMHRLVFTVYCNTCIRLISVENIKISLSGFLSLTCIVKFIKQRFIIGLHYFKLHFWQTFRSQCGRMRQKLLWLT